MCMKCGKEHGANGKTRSGRPACECPASPAPEIKEGEGCDKHKIFRDWCDDCFAPPKPEQAPISQIPELAQHATSAEKSLAPREWTLRIHSNNDGGGYLWCGSDVRYPDDDYLEVVEKSAYAALERELAAEVRDRKHWHDKYHACANELGEARAQIVRLEPCGNGEAYAKVQADRDKLAERVRELEKTNETIGWLKQKAQEDADAWREQAEALAGALDDTKNSIWCENVDQQNWAFENAKTKLKEFKDFKCKK